MNSDIGQRAIGPARVLSWLLICSGIAFIPLFALRWHAAATLVGTPLTIFFALSIAFVYWYSKRLVPLSEKRLLFQRIERLWEIVGGGLLVAVSVVAGIMATAVWEASSNSAEGLLEVMKTVVQIGGQLVLAVLVGWAPVRVFVDLLSLGEDGRRDAAYAGFQKLGVSIPSAVSEVAARVTAPVTAALLGVYVLLWLSLAVGPLVEFLAPAFPRPYPWQILS